MLGKKNLDQTVENSALATEACAGRMVQGNWRKKPVFGVTIAINQSTHVKLVGSCMENQQNGEGNMRAGVNQPLLMKPKLSLSVKSNWITS